MLNRVRIRMPFKLVVGFFAILYSLIFVTCVCIAEKLETRELYRIRFMNAKNGRVEVSTDGGHTFLQVGKVVYPATSDTEGFTASMYASTGTVAAVAVHGIRIKTAEITNCSKCKSRIISLVPREFWLPPPVYGGHRPGSSGIYTDIPTGMAIFRNLAPFVGNRVFLEMKEGCLPIQDGYKPKEGDTLVIVVEIPTKYPREIIFENQPGGLVRAIYDEESKVIARVQRPVRGIGRFDATAYTGVGRINTNHTGVLTISTAPISGITDIEACGGFMIQPSKHAQQAKEIAQVMVVEPIHPDSEFLEGMAPLFSDCIGLAYDPLDELNSFTVDMKLDNSDWMSFPPLVGKVDDALDRLPICGSRVEQIRIRFPMFSANWIDKELKQNSEMYKKQSVSRT